MCIFILISSFVINMVYWIGYIIFFPKDKNEPNQRARKSLVSVVIVFKNEAENLKKLIPIILNQDYPNFELVLVNDFSTDQSASIVESFGSDKIKLIHADHDLSGKKYALSQGVKNTNGELIILTDADCRPASTQWISLMVHQLSKGKKIVLGYGPLIGSNGLLHRFQRFETIITALQYYSYAHIGIPYMGVGRNLLYEKKHLMLHESKIKGKHLPSGDDDLTIMAMATANNVGFNSDADTWCYSTGKNSWSDLLKQKTRHTSTSLYYKTHHKALLALFALSQMSFYFFLIWCTIFHVDYFLVFAAFYFIKIMIGCLSLKNLDGQLLMKHFFYLDPLLACYYIILSPLTFLKKYQSW